MPGSFSGPTRRLTQATGMQDRPGSLREALFLPRVGVVVVAVPLPEAELVVVEELQAADPLAALPEVLLRDEEAERVAVLQLERLAVERVREQDIVVVQDRERDIGGVALLGVGHDVGRGRPDLGEAEDLLDRNSLPVRVELCPAGHAMDVRVDGLAGQRLELVPAEGERVVDLAVDLEVPGREVGPRDRAVVEDRELVGLVLAGWNSVGGRGIHLPAAEEAFEHRVSESGVGRHRATHGRPAGVGAPRGPRNGRRGTKDHPQRRWEDRPTRRLPRGSIDRVGSASWTAPATPCPAPDPPLPPNTGRSSSSSCPPTTRQRRSSEPTPTFPRRSSTGSSSSMTCPATRPSTSPVSSAST